MGASRDSIRHANNRLTGYSLKPPKEESDIEASESTWSVYVVRCNDGSLYTGIAKNVCARIDAHNAGQGAKYTRARRPVELVYRESIGDRGDALRREYAIKQLSSRAKAKLVSD